MSRWFCLMVIFFKIVVTQEDNLLFFSPHNEQLAKCIEDFLNYNKDPYYREVGIAKYIAERLTKKFFGKVKSHKYLTSSVNQLYYELRDRKNFIFRDHQVYEPLQLVMKNALIYCASGNKPNDHLHNVPIFRNEPREIANVLDYILVDWTQSLNRMILTRSGRAVLRRYAEDAGVRLAYALHSVMDHNYFRYLLRSYWMVRAQSYFNGLSTQITYLRHWYTLRHPYPHTFDNQTQLIYRNSFPLSNRNPQISQRNFNRIMYIHDAMYPCYNELDVFSVYDNNGTMGTAQYYLEIHIDQFYRILFFFVELQIRGISTDEEDSYNGPLPFDVVPNWLQAIIYDDQAYRNYLLSLKLRFEPFLTNISRIDVDHSLLNISVQEEDLISLLSIWTQENVAVKVNNETSTTTSLVVVSSTTENYGKIKRKGSILVTNKGKHFCTQPGTSSEKEQVQFHEYEEIHGYIIPNCNFTKETDFPIQKLLEVVKEDSFTDP